MTNLENLIEKTKQKIKDHKPMHGKDMLMYKKGYLAALQAVKGEQK